MPLSFELGLRGFALGALVDVVSQKGEIPSVGLVAQNSVSALIVDRASCGFAQFVARSPDHRS
jgi:hypothetical protein